MDQENAKQIGEPQQQNIPLLQAQQQPTNPYYAPYSPQVVQQQIIQQPQLGNPYQPLNINYQQNQRPNEIPQVQIQQPSIMQQQQMIPQQQIPLPPQQQQGFVLQAPFIPYAPQVVQNASGFRTPALVQCPFCNQHSITTVNYKPGTNTYWIALLLCLCFGFLCLIPLLSSDCKDAIHQCSYCGQVVGHTPYKPCE